MWPSDIISFCVVVVPGHPLVRETVLLGLETSGSMEKGVCQSITTNFFN